MIVSLFDPEELESLVVLLTASGDRCELVPTAPLERGRTATFIPGATAARVAALLVAS